MRVAAGVSGICASIVAGGVLQNVQLSYRSMKFGEGIFSRSIISGCVSFMRESFTRSTNLLS